jgi:hypothetical protein
LARTARIVAAAALLITCGAGTSQARQKVEVNLRSTAEAPRAKGRARLSVRGNSEGRFQIRAQQLERGSEYEVIVGGVKVATLQSNRRGRVQASFSSDPHGRELLLGFDPRGASIAIRKVGDDDVLGGTLPDDDGADAFCCVPDHGGDGETECEDRTAEECAAEGGTVVTATSCLPNPCASSLPTGGDIVCCIPDDGGAECEDRTPAECLNQGGTVVEAASCDPNPCAATPPADPDIQCCLPDRGGDGAAECEDRSAAECAAQGGIDMGPGTCSPNPCAEVIPPSGGTPSVRVTCERRSSRSRISVDGSGLSPGSYTARATSGANTAVAGPQSAIGDEVELDFDSDRGEGGVSISATFIQGSPPQVTGEILDAAGTVVATSTATCRDR